ncbi:hypothetical protein VNI00_000089 [Paramarasmius palmivorus]|uniref:Uncharacterized protein n=1 Tax=Paramarasmius palmivorus TaxID=297713 RepID=A0AAW0EG74_9AGAR
MAHWYPEGYIHPPSPSYPPGPQHPAYTTKIQVAPGQPVPWYATQNQAFSQSRGLPGLPQSQSSSSSRTPRGETVAGHAATKTRRPAPIAPLPDFTYFKIGHVVRVRSPKKPWSGWLYGEVMYPMLPKDSVGRPPHPSQNQQGRSERLYNVKYFQPWEGNWRLGEFDPDAGEIAPVWSNTESGPTYVLARFKINSDYVWAIAQIQGISNDRGVPVHVLTGSLKDRIVTTKDLAPYDKSVLKALTQQQKDKGWLIQAYK